MAAWAHIQPVEHTTFTPRRPAPWRQILCWPTALGGPAGKVGQTPHAQRRGQRLPTRAQEPNAPLTPALVPSPAVFDPLAGYGLPTPAVAKQLGLNEGFLNQLMELPGTETMLDLKQRLAALAQWNGSLRKGILPRAGDLAWPAEPFRSKFLATLQRLEMARFTRRYPQLLDSLLSEFLALVHEFEAELQEEEGKRQAQQQKQQRSSPQSGQQGKQEQQQQGDGGGEGGGEGNENADMEQDSSEGGRESGETKEVQVQVEDMEGGEQAGQQGEEGTTQALDQMAAQFEERVDQLLKRFEDQWGPAVESLDIAAQAFDDLDQLLEGPEGFDASRAVWRSSGWREVDSLRRKLENLRELRDLVRSLGRGGGKGPLKKAPEEVYASKHPLGVIRSPQSPEETRGLTRSGDLSRMLPLEAHLLAAGWPRQRGGGPAACAEPTVAGVGSTSGGAEGGGAAAAGDVEARAEAKGGSRACRLLFMARRAERQLMSYERAGWVEDEPTRVTGRREIRPAAELGPIIVCLDTSGSMYGARETVAKALALECMRGAHRQQRRCYLYAFSGPGQVQELELGTDAASLQRLLTFLTMSFNGGTDVDAPLALSLDRVGQEAWSLADILMVTDGEIPMPSEDVLQTLRRAEEELGLEVHGLLVGRQVTDAMKALCTHLHMFKSWSTVGGEGGQH